MKKLMLLVIVGLPLIACCQPGSYSRYDFLPGENILYADDFTQDETGELPLKWITNNRGETVTVENLPGKWFRLFPGSRFSSPAFKKLPANFTLEADILMQFAGEGGYDPCEYPWTFPDSASRPALAAGCSAWSASSGCLRR